MARVTSRTSSRVTAASWSDGGMDAGLASRLTNWTVRQAIPLIAQAQAIAELEVGAAPIRVSPKRWGFLRHGRGNAEEEGNQGHGSHHPSMDRNAGRVEPPKKR